MQVGDVGSVIEVTVVDGTGAALDVSSSTMRELVARKPGGDMVTWTATLSGDGTDGKIRYTTGSGDLDEGGQWQLQAHIVTPALDFRTEVTTFPVGSNLS